MRFAVDAHAIGRHLTGNEVYIRSLLRAFAEIDRHSEFVAYLSESGAESLVPERFHVRRVAANPYSRLGWDLARLIRADSPDLIHVQYTAPLFSKIPIVVTVHDVSFLEHPEYFTSLRGLATSSYRSQNCKARGPHPHCQRILRATRSCAPTIFRPKRSV